MIRRFVREFPKFFIAAAIILASVVTLVVWKLRRWGNEKGIGGHLPAETVKIPAIEGREGRLLLVDNDLYDLSSGEVLAKEWLKQPMLRALFYDSKTRKFIGHSEHGFVRIGVNGVVEASLGGKNKPAFSDGLDWMVFARDKDIWRADVDWKEFKPVNERKVTAIEGFNNSNFADNIMLGTEKTLVVRNMMKLLRVNLETGDVKPVRMNLGGIRKHRSPDSKNVVGLEKGQFYCYDVDSDEGKTIPVGRGMMNDYQWLGNDRCVAIAGMKEVVLYDRLKHTLSVLAALPFPCSQLDDPSADGRFVFCSRQGKGVLVDVEKKTAIPVTGGAGICWVSNDTFAFSREVPDSALRGMWLQTVGESERRISPEPCVVGKAGSHLMVLKSGGLVIFSTKHGLSKMKPDGTGVEKFGKLERPPSRALEIQQWKTE